eukprot:gb/GEZN01012790.1/.p1 GENE.gb/GEZN01012790.1/~~gb/GEZN01012790.1/.p1  ORF type:complete len:337 (+),score=82.11 gb/GEZN01012790.1/:127-1011(+)
MSKQEAKAFGAVFELGEKYPEQVRVIHIPGYSTELCGGTHVNNTRQLFPFKITKQESVSAGTRRLEARTGPAAVSYLQEVAGAMEQLADILKVRPSGVGQEVVRLQKKLADAKAESRGLQKELNRLVFAAAQASAASAANQASPHSAQDNQVHQPKGEELLVKSRWGTLAIHTVPTHRAKDVSAMRAQGDALRLTLGLGGETGTQAHLLLAPSTGLCLVVCAGAPSTSASSSAAVSSCASPKSLSALEVCRIVTAAVPGAKGGGQSHLAQLKLPVGPDLLQLLAKALRASRETV